MRRVRGEKGDERAKSQTNNAKGMDKPTLFWMITTPKRRKKNSRENLQGGGEAGLTDRAGERARAITPKREERVNTGGASDEVIGDGANTGPPRVSQEWHRGGASRIWLSWEVQINKKTGCKIEGDRF